MGDPRASSCEKVAARPRSVEDARRGTVLEEAFEAAGRPGSAWSARGRPRTPGRLSLRRAAEILAQPDGQQLAVRALRYQVSRPLSGSAVMPQTTSATRAKEPRSAMR